MVTLQDICKNNPKSDSQGPHKLCQAGGKQHKTLLPVYQSQYAGERDRYTPDQTVNEYISNSTYKTEGFSTFLQSVFTHHKSDAPPSVKEPRLPPIQPLLITV